jgi:dihydroneopterin aldolase
MKSRMFLENVKIFAYHGVLPKEKFIGNDFIVNAEIHADLEKASETDNLKDTVNYSDINEIIHNEMKIPSDLLEHVAGRIIKKTSEKFPQVTFIRVKITKTDPPVNGKMEGFTVEIEKELIVS